VACCFLGALHVEVVVFVIGAGLDFFHYEPVESLRYPKPGFAAPDKVMRPSELPDGVLECFRSCTLWIGPRLFLHDGGRYANLHKTARRGPAKPWCAGASYAVRQDRLQFPCGSRPWRRPAA
jgi:hypothetical protein